MSPSSIQFPGNDDRVFFGSENCFRSALSAEHAGNSNDNQFHAFFSGAKINDIEELLKNREDDQNPSWKIQRIRDGESECYNNAIAGLCYGTAALLQRDDKLLDKARESLSLLKSLTHTQKTPAGDPKQTELGQLAAQGDPQRDDVEEFLGSCKSPADLILLDLWNSAKIAKAPASNLCECPVAFVSALNQASILRITVKCLPSPLPVITTDLYYGGSLLWGVTQPSSPSPIVPGWKAITDVWNKLQSHCPGVRVSIGVEEYNQNQYITTPILDGDSIQAAAALAVWDAWHRTTLAEPQKEKIEKLDARLPDFELDPGAIVTAALEMQGTPDRWTLKWVNKVNAKFRAAHSLGLHIGVTARPPANAVDELARQPLPYENADTFPELCECMARTAPALRNYQKRNIDEWYQEFLNETEARQFITERDRAETEQET